MGSAPFVMEAGQIGRKQSGDYMEATQQKAGQAAQRGRAATEIRNISRKACPEQSRRDAKAAKVGR